MKTMEKIVCALMTLVLLLSSVPAVFADEAKTIDQDAACSLTIWKFDYTNAKKDGVWDEDAFPSTGWQESYVENTLVNTNRKGDTDGQNGNALGNGQTSKGYAIAGVEFTYLKAADIVTFENQGTTQVLYGFHKTDAADLLKAIGLESGANRCAEADSLDADRYFYTSDTLNKALAQSLEANSTTVKNALEAFIRNGGTAMAPTNESGKTVARDLPVGLYLLVETKVPEMVTSTTNPFFVYMPMTTVTGNDNSASQNGGTAWNYDVVVYPKQETGIPTLEKTVREAKADTGKNEGSTSITDGFAHTATGSAGDTMEYQIISTLPTITSQATALSTYNFYDTLCEGLTYSKDAGVTIEFFTDAACTDKAASWNKDSGKFSITYSEDGRHMTVDIAKAGLEEINGATANKNGKLYTGYSNYTARVTYSAVINADKSFAYGEKGNENTVILTWKRTSGDYYDTLIDDCHVFSFGLDLTKLFSDVDAETAAETRLYDSVKFKIQNKTDGTWIIAKRNDEEGIYYVTGHTDKEADNQEIRNMDDKIPAIQSEMGGHKYYSFSIEPERLLKIGYVLHRNEANKNMMPTYQRLIKKKRLTDVQHFINSGGYFPNSLIISVDSGGKGLQFDVSSTKVEGAHSRLGVLHLPKRYRSAYIIDGQHRLYGYSDSAYAATDRIPVVAFVDLDRQEQIKLFMDINENQKAVPKTLRVTLNADMLWDSSDYNERRQALRSKIAQMLGEEETSPLMGRVVIGEDEKSTTKCITVGAIQTALKYCNFFTQFGKKNTIIKDGTFDVGNNQDTCDLLYPFLEACLRYVKDAAPEEWTRGDSNDGMLTMNRGIQAVIRIINDIVNHLVECKEIFPKTQNTNDLVKQVAFYLDPLNEYLRNLTQQERKDLRGYFGGGADTRFWRAFQREIFKVRSDFNPEGLQQFLENEAKTYNADSLAYLREIESWIKRVIQEALVAKYGDNWEIKGLPRQIYKHAKGIADEKNYDSISSGDGSAVVSIWDCVTLKECKEIVTVGSHWADLFEGILTRPEEAKIPGGKAAKARWIEQIEVLQNKLNKPSYSVPTTEFDFIRAVRNWICLNATKAREG